MTSHRQAHRTNVLSTFSLRLTLINSVGITYYIWGTESITSSQNWTVTSAVLKNVIEIKEKDSTENIEKLLVKQQVPQKEPSAWRHWRRRAELTVHFARKLVKPELKIRQWFTRSMLTTVFSARRMSRAIAGSLLSGSRPPPPPLTSLLSCFLQHQRHSSWSHYPTM